MLNVATVSAGYMGTFKPFLVEQEQRNPLGYMSQLNFFKPMCVICSFPACYSCWSVAVGVWEFLEILQRAGCFWKTTGFTDEDIFCYLLRSNRLFKQNPEEAGGSFFVVTCER